ncbi:MAG: aminoacyl-tRNA hydrolase [Actinobacteria bacterium]|nr:aminoacyl-tRNA hydrolase [Actinomycetota bacterium]
MIRITQTIVIDPAEIREKFIRASGPGGQNVNKVATAVQLRFNVKNSPSLPEEVRLRLLRLGGKRITERGTLIIDARRYRTRQRNRQDALDRLSDLIRRAARKPKPRRKTKPTLASKERRLDAKKRRGRLKSLRGIVPLSQD